MSRYYPEVELFDLSVTYLLASDPLIWRAWDHTERRLDARRRGFGATATATTEVRR